MDVAYERERMISQAIEVLRKRVDKFGVAEPILQPSGMTASVCNSRPV